MSVRDLFTMLFTVHILLAYNGIFSRGLYTLYSHSFPISPKAHIDFKFDGNKSLFHSLVLQQNSNSIFGNAHRAHCIQIYPNELSAATAITAQSRELKSKTKIVNLMSMYGDNVVHIVSVHNSLSNVSDSITCSYILDRINTIDLNILTDCAIFVRFTHKIVNV